MAHAADAPRVIAGLLRDPSTRSAGVALAVEAPNEALVPELSRLLFATTVSSTPGIFLKLGMRTRRL